MINHQLWGLRPFSDKQNVDFEMLQHAPKINMEAGTSSLTQLETVDIVENLWKGVGHMRGTLAATVAIQDTLAPVL
jgi:hypothetical protein